MERVINKDSVPSATGIITDGEQLATQLHTISFKGNRQQPTAALQLPIINAVQDVSSRLVSFNAAAETGAHPSSAFHAARQIAYWSSVFISMMSTPPLSTSAAGSSATTLSSSPSLEIVSSSDIATNCTDASMNPPSIQSSAHPSPVQSAALTHRVQSATVPSIVKESLFTIYFKETTLILTLYTPSTVN